MTKAPLSTTVALAVAASLGFVGGYLFHFGFGQELPAARQALIERDVSERVMDSYKEILEAQATHQALTSVSSIEEMRVLQARSRLAVLAAVERFYQLARQSEDRRERLFAEAMLPHAMKIRDTVNAAP